MPPDRSGQLRSGNPNPFPLSGPPHYKTDDGAELNEVGVTADSKTILGSPSSWFTTGYT
jgi:hypothetical protein